MSLLMQLLATLLWFLTILAFLGGGKGGKGGERGGKKLLRRLAALLAGKRPKPSTGTTAAPVEYTVPPPFIGV